jgi:hypothetical protein
MQVTRPALALVTAVLLFAPEGRAESVQHIFEKYGLAGTWAPDCTKAASRQNPHVVYRLPGPDRLERETMIEPGRSFDVSVALSAVESSPGELTIAWKTSEGGITNRISVQQGLMQALDSIRESGEKLIVNGRRTRDNTESPRFKRCS